MVLAQLINHRCVIPRQVDPKTMVGWRGWMNLFSSRFHIQLLAAKVHLGVIRVMFYRNVHLAPHYCLDMAPRVTRFLNGVF